MASRAQKDVEEQFVKDFLTDFKDWCDNNKVDETPHNNTLEGVISGGAIDEPNDNIDDAIIDSSNVSRSQCIDNKIKK